MQSVRCEKQPMSVLQPTGSSGRRGNPLAGCSEYRLPTDDAEPADDAGDSGLPLPLALLAAAGMGWATGDMVGWWGKISRLALYQPPRRGTAPSL